MFPYLFSVCLFPPHLLICRYIDVFECVVECVFICIYIYNTHTHIHIHIQYNNNNNWMYASRRHLCTHTRSIRDRMPSSCVNSCRHACTRTHKEHFFYMLSAAAAAAGMTYRRAASLALGGVRDCSVRHFRFFSPFPVPR
jgi:hypothetical protein